MVAAERTHLSSKGQIVIPKSVRDRLGLHEGDELSVEELGDAIVLRVQRRATAGIFGPVRTLDQLIAELSALYTGPSISEAEARRRMRAGLRKRWHVPARTAPAKRTRARS